MEKKNTRRGFTLIELLVVVLIIGILAAVAVPQYQKAVVKSRFAEAMVNLKSIGQADKACQLHKGTTCDFDDLDILPGGTKEDRTHIHTPYFVFYPSDIGYSGGIAAYAQYKPESICVCYMDNGKFSLATTDGCMGEDPSFNYEELLNITDDGSCHCC